MPPQSGQVDPEATAWAKKCDPFTLVETARSGIYDRSKMNDPHVQAAISESLSRFELQQRAGLGASELVPTTESPR